MKLYMKRFTSGLMVLLLVLSLVFTGIPRDVFAASVTYSTTYNSGTRDEICTSLDGTGASDYYTSGYTFDVLSEKSSSQLLQSLRTLMTSTHKKTSSYDDCKNYANRTDCENEDGRVVLLYTSYSATMSQWNGWNREHVWPQSLGGNNTSGGGADLHHIRPSDAGVNSSRGNKQYGESNNGTAKYGSNPATGYLGGHYNSTYFEPLDNVKGDVARICLYVYVRWGSAWGADSITEVFQSVDVLLDWMELDPVDTWEMGRNEVVENIQGNRNVFIDYPEYAWLLFGRDVPEDITTPSDNDGTTSNPGCTHSWNAATCTSPKTCSKCGATEGSAAGHSWQAATCTTPKTCPVCKATEGSVASHADANGDKICDTCGTSMGPVTPPAVSGSGYILITSADQLTTGQYVMIADHGYAPGVYSDGWLTAVQPTVSDNVVTDAQGGVWTLTFDGTSVTLTDSNGVTVKPKSGNNNGIISGSYDWAWEFDESAGTTKFKGVGSDTTTLASNKTSGNMFRAYKNSTASGYPCNFKLYKLVEHTHSYVGTVTTEPTCTASGVKTYTCSGCDDSYTVIIAALGHAYDNDTDKDCNNCGEVREVGPIADANLTFLGAAGISFQDYIGMNIMFYNGTAAKYDKFYAVATQVDPAGNAVETLCNVVPYSYGGYDYTIFEHQVMAWSMTEQVTLTLYAEKDGVVYVGQSIVTSVQALALEKLAAYAKAGNAVNCAALVDMLNYGAAVQVNQNHFVGSLPSAGDYASYGTTTTPEFNAATSVTGSGIVGYGPSISMQAKVEFNVMYYGADLEGKTVKAFVDGKEVEVLYNYDAAPGWPIARIVIKASQMRSTFTIAVYDGNGNIVSQVIETSIEACGKDNLDENKNVDLIHALMRYGDSVSKVG